MPSTVPIGTLPPIGNVPTHMLAQVIRSQRMGAPLKAFEIETVEVPRPARPISRSSVAIVRDAVDCGIFSSRPAAEKLPLRATRVNSRSAKRRSLIARMDN